MTRAFHAAPLSVTQPVTFLQLVRAKALRALVFGERVDPAVILGGTVIIAAISLITWREARAPRPMVTAPDGHRARRGGDLSGAEGPHPLCPGRIADARALGRRAGQVGRRGAQLACIRAESPLCCVAA